ncbi:MAG: cyclic-di-AMP receptor [Anaerolineae bacterium]
MNAPQSSSFLILAIVQDQDAEVAIQALETFATQVVYLASVGGFLGRRNATLLIALPAEHLSAALQSLQTTCRQRVEYMTLPLEGSPLPMPSAVPVTVGGATVFALPVERIEVI